MGPSLLYNVEICIQEQPCDITDAIIEEEIRPACRVRKFLITKYTSTEILIDFKRFSTYLRLKRVVGWCYRAASAFRKKNSNIGDLNINELECVEDNLCRVAQHEIFIDDCIC